LKGFIISSFLSWFIFRAAKRCETKKTPNTCQNNAIMIKNYVQVTRQWMIHVSAMPASGTDYAIGCNNQAPSFLDSFSCFCIEFHKWNAPKIFLFGRLKTLFLLRHSVSLRQQLVNIISHINWIRFGSKSLERCTFMIHQKFGEVPTNISWVILAGQCLFQERIHLPRVFPIHVTLFKPGEFVFGTKFWLHKLKNLIMSPLFKSRFSLCNSGFKLGMKICHDKFVTSIKLTGSCPPNWLQGNARILNPLKLYLSASSENWT